MSAYVCPLCEVIAREPCDDVLQNALLAVVRLESGADKGLTVHRVRESPSGMTFLLAGFLLSRPGWNAALAAARAHVAEGCADPIECDECLPSLSVVQVDAYFWATRTSALAGS